MRRMLFILSTATLAACSQASEERGNDTAQSPQSEQAKPSVASTAAGPRPLHAHADFAGDWFGPEGLFVNVELSTPGQYTLTLAGDLDAPQDGEEFQGRDAAGGISFVRDSEELLLKRATGDETGLKYLQGKQDCLMIQQGEGFCRR